MNLAVLSVASLALATAWFAEHALGLAPCALCLWERWPYRAIIVLMALGMVASPRWGHALDCLATCMAAMACGLGLIHVGVEHHWWPSPFASCAAIHLRGGGVMDIISALPARPAKPCDAPSVIAGLPISLPIAYTMCSLSMFMALRTDRAVR